MEEASSGRKCRCRFQKTGLIRFISHLDLTRHFHRALFRAGIDLKFSEGFSPHPKFSFALPLSVGTESLCEVADFTVSDTCALSYDQIASALDKELPEGVRVLSVTPRDGKAQNEIAFAEYDVFLPRPGVSAKDLDDALRRPLSVMKTNKKGKLVEKNVSEGLRSAEATERDGGVLLHLVLSASGENYQKPESVLEALQTPLPALDLFGKRITRTRLFRQDLTEF